MTRNDDLVVSLTVFSVVGCFVILLTKVGFFVTIIFCLSVNVDSVIEVTTRVTVEVVGGGRGVVVVLIFWNAVVGRLLPRSDDDSSDVVSVSM